jgi:hypothetical protein
VGSDTVKVGGELGELVERVEEEEDPEAELNSE